MNFSGGFIEKTCFSRRFSLFVEQTLLSHRTDANFPRNSYLVLKRIQIFQELYFLIEQILIFKPYHLVLEHIRFSRRPSLVPEHIRFSRRPLCLEQICIFQEGTPLRTDISLIGLDGCFRYVIISPANIFLRRSQFLHFDD